MSEQNVHAVKTMYEQFRAGNLDGAIAVIDPGVVWNEGDGHPYGPPVTGIDDVREKVFERLGSEWVGMVTDPQEWLDCRDYVVVLGRDEATFKATGKSVNTGVAHVFTLRNGKITSFTQYCDTHGWHEAMKA